MFTRLKEFFSSPGFDNEGLTRRAGLLNTLLISFSLATMLLFIGVTLGILVIDPALAYRFYIIILVVFVLMLCLRWLMRRGQVALASNVLAISLSLATTTALYFAGSVRAPLLSFYVLTILIVGLLVNSRAAAGMAAFNSFCVLALVLAERAGLLPPYLGTITLTQWITPTVIFGLMAVLLHLVNLSITEALARAHRELAERKQVEENLRASAQQYRELFAVAERQAQELILLDKARSALARELDLSALLRSVVHSIGETFGYTQVSLYLLENNVLNLQHQIGYESVIARIPLNKGVIGRVVRFGRALLIEDVRADADFLQATEGVLSEVCVPLFDEGKVVGALNVESTRGVKLTDADLQLMTALGEHIGVAISRARLYSDLQKQNRTLFSLQAATLVVMEKLELNDVLHSILFQAAQLINTEHGYLYLTEPDESALLAKLGLGAFTPLVGTFLKPGEGLAGKIWQTARPMAVEDYHTWSGRSAIFEAVAFHAVAGVPITGAAKVIGVLGLSYLDPERKFSAEDIELLNHFAHLASLAIKNARLYAQVQQELAERKQAEENLLHFRRVMDDSNDAIFIIEPETSRYIDFNKTAYEFLGYTSEELKQLGVVDVAQHVTSQQEWHARVALVLEKDGLIFETHYKRKDGTSLPVEVSARMRPYAEKTMMVAFVRDITERKKAEATLQRLNNELEVRVAERTAQLEAANKELEAFSYSVSHDLRAPLRAIDGYSRFLAEDYVQQLPQAAQQYLTNIREGSQRMGKLINDLLALSRITRQTLKYEQVNLSNIAHAIAVDLKKNAPQRSIEFIIANGLTVHGDPGLLQVLLDNLLNNAWKYSARRANARIEFGTSAQRDGNRAFFVRDNGAGFNMAHADKLFGAFQRLHSDDDFEGTGIGLATVQRIIQRHGGRIWAEGEVDKGATFYFTLGQSVTLET